MAKRVADVLVDVCGKPELSAYTASAVIRPTESPTSRRELSMFPTITYEQGKGFSLFMMKAVLSGRADEVIDLAMVHLLR